MDRCVGWKTGFSTPPEGGCSVTTSRIARTVVKDRQASLSVVAAPSGIVVLDHELRIVSVQASARLGRIGPDHMGELLGAVDPEIHRGIAAAARRVLRTGSAEVGLEIAAAAGPYGLSLFPAPDPASETVSCVFAGAPARGGGAGVLAAVVESTADAIVSTDLGGLIRSWNAGAERLYGYTAAEAVGRPIALLEPSGRRESWGELTRRIAGGYGDQGRETIRSRKDGARVEVWLTVAPVRDGDGRAVGFSEIGRDVTSRRRDERRTERALRESERRRRQVVASMLHAEEVERSRIATELHDDTVQVMIASMMAMDRVALVAQRSGSAQLESAVSVARATLEEATDRTRRLMFELRPAVLLRDGLVAAVRVLAQQVARETGATTRVRGTVSRYDHAVEELVYRSVQEALANVRKHARPDSISVTLVERRGAIRAEICDDGLGFDIIDARSRPQAALHLGLDALLERIGAVGGRAEIISSPGQGTCVRFTVPVAGFERASRNGQHAAAVYER
jgi:PAS domain S-box-containing protein